MPACRNRAAMVCLSGAHPALRLLPALARLFLSHSADLPGALFACPWRGSKGAEDIYHINRAEIDFLHRQWAAKSGRKAAKNGQNLPDYFYVFQYLAPVLKNYAGKAEGYKFLRQKNFALS